LFIGLLLLAVVGGCLFAYRPALGRLRDWRAANLLDQAQELAEEGEWHEVARKAMASGQLRPSIRALRLYFNAQGRTGDPRILGTAAVIATHPRASAADHALVISLFLDVRDLISCRRIIATLGEERRNVPAVRLQIGRFLLARGDFDAALALSERGDGGAASAALDLLIARRLFAHSDDALRHQGTGRVGRMLAGKDRARALEAMRVLATQPGAANVAGLAWQAVQRFGGDLGLAVGERLDLALLRWRIEPERRGGIVRDAVSRYGEGESLGVLLSWLLRVDAVERVVALTDPEAATIDVFRLRADALRQLGRYAQLATELGSAPVGFPAAELAAYQAAVFRLVGAAADEAARWQQSFSYGDLQPASNPFYTIAKIAAQVGAKDIQMEALARGLEHPVGIPPMAHELGEVFGWLAKRDTRRLLGISRRLLRREPGNPELINNYHYLTILHGTPNAQTVADLSELVATFPEAVPFRGSLACGQLSTGDAAAALATLDAVAGSPDALPDAERAVYSATLFALGDKAGAEALGAGIDWTALVDGEREWFRRFQGISPDGAD